MVKSSNRAQQRRSLPCSGTTIKRGKESAAKQAKQKVNNQTKKKGIHFVNDKLSQDHIQTIVIEILRKWRQCEPKNKNGDPPFGSLAKLIEQYRKTQQWLENGNKVKMKWRNMSEENKRRINLALPLEEKKKKVPPKQPPKPTADPGRPIGSTKKAKQEQKQKFISMKNAITSAWSKVRDLPLKQRPLLVDVIEQKQQLFGLDPLIYPVSTNCIYSRFERGRLQVSQTGQISPAWKIEPRLVQLIELSTRCNNEMTKEEIIDFANSYIEGSMTEVEIIRWKLAHHKGWQRAVREFGIIPKRADLGDGWFNGFINRFKYRIQYKPSSNVSYYRKEFCTYEMFDQMYDNVYNQLVECNYAEIKSKPTFYNKLGVACEEDDEEAFGNIVDLAFTRPDLVFVADECGSNTNMSRDKMSAGNKRCSSVGCAVKVPACTSDCHFTTLAWTSLTGEPAFAVMIIQKSSPLTYAEMNGFDIEATWVGNDEVFQSVQDGSISIDDAVFTADDLKRNTGKGKVFPGGPVCTYKGVDIPTLIRRSDSGGITTEILVDVLRHFDKHVPRVPGDPPPACILDGHSSRLSIPFLRYICDHNENGDVVPGSNHRWNVFLGLPNGTAYWQVGDSSQQNGRFKNLNRTSKEYLRNEQRKYYDSICIRRHHAVIILSFAWDNSYGDVIGNKKAILERGWNPLNRGVLHHDDIRKKDPSIGVIDSGSSISDDSGIDDANVSQGSALKVLNVLQSSVRRDIGREAQYEENKKQIIENRQENAARVLTIGRVTAGTVFKAGVTNLNNDDFCALMEAKNKKKLDKKAQSQSRRYDADLKKYLDGELLMKKTVLHYAAMKDEVYFLVDVNEKKAAIKRLKKEKKWLLSSDYLGLIQYKQLAMEKYVKPPTKIDDRIAQWESLYRSRRDPTMPVKPTNYVITSDVEDDDEAVALDLLTSVPADLPPLPVIAPTADTDGDIANIAQSLLTLSTAPNIQGNAQAL